MNNYEWILREAEKDFESGMNWLDFHNKYFGIGNKYIPKNKEERIFFLESDVFKKLSSIKNQLKEKQPEIIEPEYSGKFNLRVGKTLHKELTEIATQENLSLNTLLISILSEKVGEYRHL